MNLPSNPSESLKRANPHLYAGSSRNSEGNFGELSKERVRQSRKPLLNKLETEFLEILRRELPEGTVIHKQAWRVKIANGSWFKVDFCACVNGHWIAWETKGPKSGKNVARGILALKCAASAFPEIVWNLAWKEHGTWKTQHVLS